MVFAAIFPGQGSQKIGMLSGYVKKYPEIKQTFERASELLSVNLFDMVTKGTEENLNLTVNTQPILLAASYALWQVWCRVTDLRPAVMAGHSLGEYSALTCSGALDFDDAVLMVRHRAELMQRAVPIGKSSMAAVIGIGRNHVEQMCRDISRRKSGTVEPANYNSHKQTVVAGDKELVDEFSVLIKEREGVKVVPLPVSVPSHTSLMKSTSTKFSRYLSKVKFHDPKIPVIQNATGEVVTSKRKIALSLKSQIRKPVLWHQSIKVISDSGVDRFVEMGPGRVLSGLVRRIDKTLYAQSMETPENLKKILESEEL